MVGLVVFVSMSLLAVSQAAPPIQCDNEPGSSATRCLDTPHFVERKITSQCEKTSGQCESITCIYRKSGWMDGDEIDKSRLTAYFDQFAKDHPQWQPAVDHLKSACIQAELPVLGIYLNCPAYDTMWCIVESFVRHALPSQWSSTAECQSVRQFYAVCPFCPEQCRARVIPVGSCNACNPMTGRS